ncbi:MAG: hypothetical protein HKN23_17085, partial [Verrucomicrobiales bacterium]|nr:hypothetical protein [Verrucomicrobiales bacterium]
MNLRFLPGPAFFCGASLTFAQLPVEPLEIPPVEPNFVHDSWLIDNHWPLKTKQEGINVAHHPLQKHASGPFEIFGEDKPSYAWVVKDEADDGSRIFRMYYQANIPIARVEGKGSYRTDIAYAESKDGISWTKPDLDLFPEKAVEGRPNNVVVAFEGKPQWGGSAPALIENLPDGDQRRYRFVMLYRVKGRGTGDQAGLHLVGTKDGIHFDMVNDFHIAHLHSDCPNTIHFDPAAGRYQLLCRAKQIYRAFGDEMIDTGASRRVATMFSPKLWTDWLEHSAPQTLLVPDERDGDHRYFYGMPTVHRHGLAWGFLEVFRMNDLIHTEVVTSRDGAHWWRHADRPKLIEYGEDGTWDDTMTFTSPAWVAVGNHWYIYYSGWDGPHGTSEREGTIGLATCLRERIYSRRGSKSGGVVCTRTLTWP